MSASISTLLGKQHAYERAPNDRYREPRWLVERYLDKEPFRRDHRILDPFCGGGTIVSCSLDRGLDAVGSDIIDYGFGAVRDFFDLTEPVDCIFSNPPFVLAEPAARHALTLARYRVVFFSRIGWLEGRERYETLFAVTPPTRVLVSIDRASMPPGTLDGPRDKHGAIIVPKATGGSMPYAIFVWERAKHTARWRRPSDSLGWL